MRELKLVDRLWDDHSKAVFLFTFSMTNDKASAEEIVQETFLRALERYPEARQDSPGFSPRGWLFLVARNLFIDKCRKERSWSPIDDASQPSVLESADQLVNSIVLAEALARLSVEHQMAIRLCVLEHRPIEQAAQIAGVPVGTVKSRTYYALKLLRLHLDEMGFGQWTNTAN